MNRTKLKTITLCRGDDPSTVVCPGHVSAKVFNQAFKNEGWDSLGAYKQSELRYIYAVVLNKKNRFMKEVRPDFPGAKKFTTCRWD